MLLPAALSANRATVLSPFRRMIAEEPCSSGVSFADPTSVNTDNASKEMGSPPYFFACLYFPVTRENIGLSGSSSPSLSMCSSAATQSFGFQWILTVNLAPTWHFIQQLLEIQHIFPRPTPICFQSYLQFKRSDDRSEELLKNASVSGMNNQVCKAHFRVNHTVLRTGD